jgi:hypothetical protein
MRCMMLLRVRLRWGLFALLATAVQVQTATAPPVTVEPQPYHGWNDALRLRNRHVEVIVVPEVGRVMSFRFLDGENVFWEDRALDGKRGLPRGDQWVNFGGDKTWPAPEAEWKDYTGYNQWMPPPGFDGEPASARREAGAVILISPVDRFYGTRALRRIALAPDAAVLTITTTYERVSGAPAKIGIWVITQFKDPVAVYLPIPRTSSFPHGHFVFRDTPWPQLTRHEGLIRVTRDPKANHKLGSDADRMLWVGETAMCLVESPRVAGAEYPDRGASAEVYTNSDPKTYVELETLGPLKTMKTGDRIQQTNTYTLLRRKPGEADGAAARKILLRD